jgi:hypothetical protein
MASTGTYTSQSGASACIPCPIGTFANKSGMQQCEPCTLGLGFSNTTGLASCFPRRTSCPPGQFVTLASTANVDNGCSRCMPCDENHLAAYQQPGGTDILLLTSTQVSTNAVALKTVCPGKPSTFDNKTITKQLTIDFDNKTITKQLTIDFDNKTINKTANH